MCFHPNMGRPKWVLLVGFGLVAACSVIVNSKLDDKPDSDGGADAGVDAGDDTDAGMDAAPPDDDCAGEDDGTVCGDGQICLDEVCDDSFCGDGFIDEDNDEECDDENDIPGDGCEPTCEVSCTEDEDCDDGDPCNGVEVCNEDNACDVPVPVEEGDPCPLPPPMMSEDAGMPDGGMDAGMPDAGGPTAGECRGGMCVRMGCGNGVPDFGEECDDGNQVEGDGCDTDCTLSCRTDEDCNDGNVCNGEETCDIPNNACVAGTDMACSDGDDCTADECDSEMGCVYPLIDEDGDGHASTDLGSCGTDCDDTDPTTFEGAEELCDDVDHNCNGSARETEPTWYLDCDNDGFAADTSVTMPGCTEPPPQAGCAGWTTIRPVSTANTDCHDDNPAVRPSQTVFQTRSYTTTTGTQSWDYNCDNNPQVQYRCPGFIIIGGGDGCEGFGRSCTGARYYVSDSETTYCDFIGTTLIRRPPPACGRSGTLSSCGTIACTRGTSQYTQRCL